MQEENPQNENANNSQNNSLSNYSERHNDFALPNEHSRADSNPQNHRGFESKNNFEQKNSSENKNSENSFNKHYNRHHNGDKTHNHHQNRDQRENGQNRENAHHKHHRHNHHHNKENQPNKEKNKKENHQNPEIAGFEPTSKKFNAANMDLRKMVETNAAIHESTLKASINSNGRIRITPLGGLGEIGANITIIETQNSAIIIDLGMSFPDSTKEPGVDIVVPDFSYIETIKDKVAGVLITHAHEDHIGAAPYFFKKFQFPLYATPLPLGLIGEKFDEHGLKRCRDYFRPIKKREIYKIGEFEVEWIHITHSIVDSSALAIRTEAGLIMHTGDFKIDHTPIDGYPTDLNRIAHYGEDGVLLMLSDSTNSHKPGYTPSEATVGPLFDMLYSKTKGRVIMSTFSSNIHRVYQAIMHGIKYGRKVAIIGRSMEKNIEIARQLKYIEIPQKVFIEAHEVAKYSDSELLIITTGSQGESMSALYRMATDEHRFVKLKEGDTVILSAKAIPGNEGAVADLIDFITKHGAKVHYQDFSEIHTSGHAAQEEQKLLLRLIKPKFFLPVHGEYNHILKHSQTAISCGVDEKNIYLMENGDQIEIASNYIRKVRSVRNGKTYVDNQLGAPLANEAVNMRKDIMENGAVFVSISCDKIEQSASAKVAQAGLAGGREVAVFEQEIESFLDGFFKSCKKELFSNARGMENEVQNQLKKLLFKKTKRYPVILVKIFV